MFKIFLLVEYFNNFMIVSFLFTVHRNFFRIFYNHFFNKRHGFMVFWILILLKKSVSIKIINFQFRGNKNFVTTFRKTAKIIIQIRISYRPKQLKFFSVPILANMLNLPATCSLCFNIQMFLFDPS